MKRETKALLFSGGMLALVFNVVILFAIVFSYFEAEAFNRHTGQNVSTWDALFLELRIQDDGKEQGTDAE